MPASAASANLSSNASGRDTHNAPGKVDRVVACLDKSRLSQKVIPYAAAIAQALHAHLTLLQVLEVTAKAGAPADPIEWGIGRREAHDHIDRLASEWDDGTFRIDTIVIEGQPAEQISLWARNQGASLIVVGTHGDSGLAGWSLGSTARSLVEKASGALLLVPSSVPDARAVHYRRLLVPLDGSRQAESILPLATRLAKAEQAKLLLTHVIPVPELTEIGPLEAEDIELREQVVRRNERVARQYLERIRAGIAEQDVSVDIILREGDVRNRLSHLAVDEAADLVVLSAHGRGGRPDVSCGSVAFHLMTHAAAPLLLVLRPSPPEGGVVLNNKTRGGPPGRAAL
ncbi:universal stress protein [Mesorhizobium sp.]|uniref:universal stress protein n=1 Tax=Mesorhizobium sp. TaxID=1871066 RepID=UPI000FE7EB0C|nr:universal stress protein [Mesorhizobium sp.]RWM24642.1 MAG: universal stress protein [Mesorhizobium sp.]TJV53471.1 MAG: universal stress protein [Mesorhizobium sp.]